MPVRQTAPALNAIITYHVFGVIAFKGEPQRRGCNPSERLSCHLAFLQSPFFRNLHLLRVPHWRICRIF
jgi:hypothetical protein